MNSPVLSVVLISPFSSIASSIELIIVVASPDSLADARPGELEGFANVQILPVGPISAIDVAAVSGFNAATAPLICYSDDHAYLQPGWAEAIVQASSGPWGVMVSLLENANPASAWSWVNLICSYGWWAEGATGGECVIVPGHNVTFRRKTAFAEGPIHPQALRRQSGLFEELRARGVRFALVAGARSKHMNAATASSTWLVRFNMGRYYGHTRAAAEHWTFAKRILYMVGFPLIPILRFLRLNSELPGLFRTAGLRTYPALYLGLCFDAVGQAIGYGFGPGDSLPILENYEVHLRQYVLPDEAISMDL
jgi:hypothetical protein